MFLQKYIPTRKRSSSNNDIDVLLSSLDSSIDGLGSIPINNNKNEEEEEVVVCDDDNDRIELDEKLLALSSTFLSPLSAQSARQKKMSSTIKKHNICTKSTEATLSFDTTTSGSDDNYTKSNSRDEADDDDDDDSGDDDTGDECNGIISNQNDASKGGGDATIPTGKWISIDDNDNSNNTDDNNSCSSKKQKKKRSNNTSKIQKLSKSVLSTLLLHNNHNHNHNHNSKSSKDWENDRSIDLSFFAEFGNASNNKTSLQGSKSWNHSLNNNSSSIRSCHRSIFSSIASISSHSKSKKNKSKNKDNPHKLSKNEVDRLLLSSFSGVSVSTNDAEQSCLDNNIVLTECDPYMEMNCCDLIITENTYIPLTTTATASSTKKQQQNKQPTTTANSNTTAIKDNTTIDTSNKNRTLTKIQPNGERCVSHPIPEIVSFTIGDTDTSLSNYNFNQHYHHSTRVHNILQTQKEKQKQKEKHKEKAQQLQQKELQHHSQHEVSDEEDDDEDDELDSQDSQMVNDDILGISVNVVVSNNNNNNNNNSPKSNAVSISSNAGTCAIHSNNLSPSSATLGSYVTTGKKQQQQQRELIGGTVPSLSITSSSPIIHSNYASPRSTRSYVTKRKQQQQQKQHQLVGGESKNVLVGLYNSCISPPKKYIEALPAYCYNTPTQHQHNHNCTTGCSLSCRAERTTDIRELWRIEDAKMNNLLPTLVGADTKEKIMTDIPSRTTTTSTNQIDEKVPITTCTNDVSMDDHVVDENNTTNDKKQRKWNFPYRSPVSSPKRQSILQAMIMNCSSTPQRKSVSCRAERTTKFDSKLRDITLDSYHLNNGCSNNNIGNLAQTNFDYQQSTNSMFAPSRRDTNKASPRDTCERTFGGPNLTPNCKTYIGSCYSITENKHTVDRFSTGRELNRHHSALSPTTSGSPPGRFQLTQMQQHICKTPPFVSSSYRTERTTGSCGQSINQRTERVINTTTSENDGHTINKTSPNNTIKTTSNNSICNDRIKKQSNRNAVKDHSKLSHDSPIPGIRQKRHNRKAHPPMLKVNSDDDDDDDDDGNRKHSSKAKDGNVMSSLLNSPGNRSVNKISYRINPLISRRLHGKNNRYDDDNGDNDDDEEYDDILEVMSHIDRDIDDDDDNDDVCRVQIDFVPPTQLHSPVRNVKKNLETTAATANASTEKSRNHIATFVPDINLSPTGTKRTAIAIPASLFADLIFDELIGVKNIPVSTSKKLETSTCDKESKLSKDINESNSEMGNGCSKYNNSSPSTTPASPRIRNERMKELLKKLNLFDSTSALLTDATRLHFNTSGKRWPNLSSTSLGQTTILQVYYDDSSLQLMEASSAVRDTSSPSIENHRVDSSINLLRSVSDTVEIDAVTSSNGVTNENNITPDCSDTVQRRPLRRLFKTRQTCISEEACSQEGMVLIENRQQLSDLIEQMDELAWEECVTQWTQEQQSTENGFLKIAMEEIKDFAKRTEASRTKDSVKKKEKQIEPPLPDYVDDVHSFKSPVCNNSDTNEGHDVESVDCVDDDSGSVSSIDATSHLSDDEHEDIDICSV